MKAKPKVKTGERAKPKRRIVKRSRSGQAADFLKTFMKLEDIKKNFVPSVYSEDMTAEQIIRAAKDKRAAGGYDDDEIFFALAYAFLGIGGKRHDTDAELARIDVAIEAKGKKYGLKEDEDWRPGEAPEDVEKLRDAWNKRSRQIEVEVMRGYGEDGMADLYMADQKEFFRRQERGREKVFGPLPKELKGKLGAGMKRGI